MTSLYFSFTYSIFDQSPFFVGKKWAHPTTSMKNPPFWIWGLSMCRNLFDSLSSNPCIVFKISHMRAKMGFPKTSRFCNEKVIKCSILRLASFLACVISQSIPRLHKPKITRISKAYNRKIVFSYENSDFLRKIVSFRNFLYPGLI